MTHKSKAQTNVSEIANDLNNLSRLYNSDEETGTLSSNSAFYLNHQPDHLQSSPQAFHYNDKDMSYLLNVSITAADDVSLTFSALGSDPPKILIKLASVAQRGIININNPTVPSLRGEMLSELMTSFDQRMTNSSHQ